MRLLATLVDIPVLRFLKEETPSTLHFVFGMSILSGTAGGALLGIINTAASPERVPTDIVSTHRLALLFLITLALLVVTKWVSLVRSTAVVEEMLRSLRLRICNKLRRADLETVESLEESDILSAVARDTSTISQSVKLFANMCQQAILLAAGMAYLAWLSKPAFAFMAVAGMAAAYFYLVHAAELRATYALNHAQQAQMLYHLTDLLRGFKELAQNGRKSGEQFDVLASVATETASLSIKSSGIFARSMMFADLILYLLLGMVVFVLPQLAPGVTGTISQTAVAVMFVFGPLGAVVGTLPQLSNADAALDNLYALEERLDRDLECVEQVVNDAATFGDFRGIVLNSVMFNYGATDDQKGFILGPVSMDIRRGEVIFIVGGNGSGKTTLLKLLTGLYRAREGTLQIDGESISACNISAYRQLFAGVFAEFHLFDRLYGISPIDPHISRELLYKLGIHDKVFIENERFSTTALSTGQRKRLALLAALLEDRPIYVFDEWTADQDPVFRAYFYDTLLPDLKREGKTIIAITHDDRYWHKADRIVTLDNGHVVVKEV
jgi:putative pyoverdin transport system ATP-binding/permease protein